MRIVPLGKKIADVHLHATPAHQSRISIQNFDPKPFFYLVIIKTQIPLNIKLVLVHQSYRENAAFPFIAQSPHLLQVAPMRRGRSSTNNGVRSHLQRQTLKPLSSSKPCHPRPTRIHVKRIPLLSHLQTYHSPHSPRSRQSLVHQPATSRAPSTDHPVIIKTSTCHQSTT